MWMFSNKEDKFSEILSKLSKIDNKIKDIDDRLQDWEDEGKENNKENNLVISLQQEIITLKQELLKKQNYIEGLLTQILSGASLQNIMALAAQPKESPVSPAVKAYLDRKNQNNGQKPKLPG